MSELNRATHILVINGKNITSHYFLCERHAAGVPDARQLKPIEPKPPICQVCTGAIAVTPPAKRHGPQRVAQKRRKETHA